MTGTERGTPDMHIRIPRADSGQESRTAITDRRAPALADKYPHYYKPCPYTHVDVYRVIALFGITDPCLQHALKKLLVAGGRGSKGIETDVKEVIASCERFLDMRREEQT